MMNSFSEAVMRFNVLKLLTIASVVFCSSAIAFALELSEAKAKGLVGETATGYLAAVSANPAPEVKSLVEDINAKRKTHYRSIASENGTPVVAVEKLAAEKAINRASKGEMVRLPDGTWQKR